MSDILKLKDIKSPLNCVLTYGHFTTIHAGHVRYLKHAYSKNKNVVVALIGDKQNNLNFQFPQHERASSLAHLTMINKIVLLEGNEINEAVIRINPEILLLGKEHEATPNKQIKEAVIYLKKRKKLVVFHSGETNYATTQLLNNSENDLAIQRKNEFKLAIKRQNLNKKNLLDSLQTLSSSKLLVIGDSIIDQFAACEAIGMSAEAPVIVVKELEQKNFIGGAAIVASHITALNSKCDFITVTGQDENSSYLKKELKKRNIGDHIIIDKSRPTTFKKRYIVENQKIFRVSKLEEKNISLNLELEIIKKIDLLAEKVDGIIVSDFGYGIITNKIIDYIYKKAKEFGLLLFGDVQSSSQIGDITKLKNYSLLCPNEREARIALRDKESGLESISKNLMNITNSEKIIMKLGSNGFIAFEKTESSTNSQPFPALTVNPVDTSGAGDSLLAVMSAAMASKQSMMTSAALSCCIAALSVTKMGNQPIHSHEIKDFINEILL